MSEGIWEVVTETSTYIYDRDAKTVTRLPGGLGSIDETPVTRSTLRKDAEVIPVLSAPEPKVGERWLITLAVRGDGISTQRLTTHVRQVTRSES